MNRVIKFRIIIGNKIVNYINPAEEGFIHSEFLVDWIKEGKCKWQQFTGLKDETGKEIYEGDIVIKTINSDPHNYREPFEVIWNQQHCGFGIAVGNNHGYKIMGNIFETPELLK